MTVDKPKLTVIATSTDVLCQVPGNLTALRTHCHAAAAEIILTAASDQDTYAAIVKQYPDIRFIRLSETCSVPKMLGKALASASGDIIAITDTTCEIGDHWAQNILKAHTKPNPVIGGAVEPRKFNSMVDTAAYFYDYCQFMLPVEEGISAEIPGNNMSAKRWILEKQGEFSGEEFWKTYWCRKIQSDGESLYLFPSIIVYYEKSFGLLPYLLNRFHNGRCFAGMRNNQISFSKRIIYATGSPLLPILICIRILKSMLSKRRYMLRFFICFPIIILASVHWAIGEFAGYLLGKGSSCVYVR